MMFLLASLINLLMQNGFLAAIANPVPKGGEPRKGAKAWAIDILFSTVIPALIFVHVSAYTIKWTGLGTPWVKILPSANPQRNHGVACRAGSDRYHQNGDPRRQGQSSRQAPYTRRLCSRRGRRNKDRLVQARKEFPYGTHYCCFCIHMAVAHRRLCRYQLSGMESPLTSR